VLHALLLALGFHPGAQLLGGGRQAAEAAARLAGPVDRGFGSATLSRVELEDLVAFAETLLVEDRVLLPLERRDLVEHVEYRVARDVYYLSLYRTTVSVLERLAGARFATLEGPRRIELVTRHRLASPRVRPDEPLGPHADDTREVRTRAVPDLIAGYYNSPAGWAVVGYDVFPGQCGDLDRYTRPEV
jgi:hypothetical protein